MSGTLLEVVREVAVEVWAGEVASELPRRWWERDTTLFVASYSESFDELWALGDGCLGGLAEGIAERRCAATVLLIGDGPPPDDAAKGPVALASALTVVDWAMALSCAIYRHSVEVTGPDLRVLILDIGLAAPRGSFASSTLELLRGAFPWIQCYRPVSTDDGSLVDAALPRGDPTSYSLLRAAVPWQRQEFVTLLGDLAEPSRVLTSFSELDDLTARRSALAQVRSAWKHYLLRARSRHDVANLIAPLVLADGLTDREGRGRIRKAIEGTSSLRRAFTSLLEETGLLRAETVETPTRSQAGRPLASLSNGLFAPQGRPTVLLVDDQYDLGFHHVLAYQLFGRQYEPPSSWRKDSWAFDPGNGSAALRCVRGKPGELLAKLDPVEDWSVPRCLALDPAADILLLDLRLWEAHATSARNTFFRQLLAEIERIGADAISDPCFQAALSASQRLTSGNDIAGELAALPLMVLLLSHYDPSFPIVLFSSTQQRAVLAQITHRPNIITLFSKPVISGYGLEAPEEALGNLRAALERAFHLHGMRMLWERLCTLEEGTPHPASVLQKGDEGWTRETRPARWRLTGDNLKCMLAVIYQKYLVAGRLDDFMAVPWEVVEGLLVPDDVLTDPDLKSDGLSCEPKARYVLGRALQLPRHRKSHGFLLAAKARSEESADVPTGDGWAVLMFSALLDFIAGRPWPPQGNDRWHSWLTTWWDGPLYLLKRRVSRQVGKAKEWKTTWPDTVTSDSRVATTTFVLFCLANATLDAVEDGASLLSPPTRLALVKALDAEGVRPPP